MQTFQPQDLIRDQYYVLHEYNNRYIFKFESLYQNQHMNLHIGKIWNSLRLNRFGYSSINSNILYWQPMRSPKLVKATDEEIIWLDECHKAGILVDKPILSSRFLNETTVITKNGNIFTIGDNVNHFNQNNEPFIISHFNTNKMGNIRASGLTINNKLRIIKVDNLELVIDKFKLPRKWAVKINEDNIETLSVWRNNSLKPSGYGINKRSIGKYIYYLSPFTTGYTGYIADDLRDNIEITFEQFTKYILNK